MIVGTAKIEHHPENGRCPHVVILAFDQVPNMAFSGARLWFAYHCREEAEIKLDLLALSATAQWDQELQVLRP